MSVFNAAGVVIILIIGFVIIRLALERILDSLMVLVKQYLFQVHGDHFTFDQEAIDNIAQALAVIIYMIVFLSAFWSYVLFA